MNAQTSNPAKGAELWLAAINDHVFTGDGVVHGLVTDTFNKKSLKAGRAVPVTVKTAMLAPPSHAVTEVPFGTTNTEVPLGPV